MMNRRFLDFLCFNVTGLPLIWLAALSGPLVAQPTILGERVPRTGDEIVVCGQLFHTTAPVVLWMDPGGYDAYRVERRFAPLESASWQNSAAEVKGLDTPNRYGLRMEALTDKQIERVRGGGWDLALLQQVVDQFVFHYDVCGTSQTCFKVLHDHRGLSVQFMLDVDGTIYQTLDLKERAWHATISNSRSIGVEIANMGAYPPDDRALLDRWYMKNAAGLVEIALPKEAGLLGIRTTGFVGRPMRNDLVIGTIQGQELCQYDFTPEQYDSLIKLTATLCKIFPKLKCSYPADDGGQLIPHKLPDEDWRAFQGILGHYHVQTNKVDPGPAMQWDRVLDGARALLRE